MRECELHARGGAPPVFIITLAPTTQANSGQMQKPASHPVVSVMKICIRPKRLRSEVHKKALLEIQWPENKARSDKVRGEQT